MENEPLTPQESLDLIGSMIRQAKGNIQNNSFYFLLWGWTVTMAHIAIYFMLAFANFTNSEANLVWLIMAPAVIVSFAHGKNDHRIAQFISPLESVMIWVWISFFTTTCTIIAFGSFINFQINPLILILSSIPTLLTGKIIKFAPFVVAGVLFWVLGAICFLVSFKYQNLICAFGYATGYLLPGYLLKNKKEL